MLTSIVFSKDRPMQLAAFLQSHADLVERAGCVQVLYRATSRDYEKAYEQVFTEFPRAVAHRQDSFKERLSALMPASGLVMFFVDDQMFVRSWSALDAEPGLSLRLGLNLTKCYTTGSVQSFPPHVWGRKPDQVQWVWADGQGDWGYPLSLDGHVFEATELRSLMRSIDFSSPNTLEAALQQFLPEFLSRRGTCYRMSKVVNVPLNQVQTDWANRHGSEHDADELLARWQRGERINVRALYGVVNESVHQELPVEFACAS